MTLTRSTVCPWCQHRHDHTSAVAAKQPGAPKGPEPEAHNGDISFCANCGSISIFDTMARSGLRFPTEAEHADMASNRVVSKLRATHALINYQPISRWPGWWAKKRGGPQAPPSTR